MFSEGYSFPHPVLGVGDDIEGEFNFSLKIERRNDSRKIFFTSKELEVKNKYFSQLLKEGFAEFLISIYCGATYRSWVSVGLDDFEIPEDEVVSRIEIQGMLVAVKQIPNYFDDSFNPDYEQTHFSISKAEVVGISAKKRITIEKIDEQLSLGSLFSWKVAESDQPLDFSLEADQIEIVYPKSHDGGHPPSLLFKIKPWTAYCIFILPALEQAFIYIKESKESAERFEWYRVLEELLPEDQRTDSPFINAQMVVKGMRPLLESHSEYQ